MVAHMPLIKDGRWCMQRRNRIGRPVQRRDLVKKRLHRRRVLEIQEAIPYIELGLERDVTLTALRASGDLICPICRANFAMGQDTRICIECGVKHHKECWNMIRGCSTFGCKYAPDR